MPVIPIIGAIGVVASVAGTVASVAAAGQQASNQQEAANYNAQVAANNAQVATWQRQQQEQEYAAEALMTQQQGAQDASRLELQNGSIVARNIAAAASSGMDITGSTQDAISGSAANNELAVLNEQHKTQIEAYQNEIGASNASYNSVIQANRYDAESQLDTMEGKAAAQTGMYSEIGAGISGVTRTLGAINSFGTTSGLWT
jgi:hypothetical protein